MKKYNIIEIFYSIQSEGFYTGTPVIFIRFFGCNLQCSFCDEKDKINYNEYEIKDIIFELEKYKCKNVVLTGGEPSLQIDRNLLEELQKRKYKIFVETNGFKKLPLNSAYYNWITVSPKTNIINQKFCNEIKIVYNGQTKDEIEEIVSKVNKCLVYLQPESNKKEYVDKAIKLLEDRKGWQLSIQWHKLIGVK